MDVMVHDTLVKLCTDHFESKDIEAARQLLYRYDAIMKLNLMQSRRRQGPSKDKTNVEDILLALHRCRSGLPTFVVADISNLPSLDANGIYFGHILSGTSYLSGPKLQSFGVKLLKIAQINGGGLV